MSYAAQFGLLRIVNPHMFSFAFYPVTVQSPKTQFKAARDEITSNSKKVSLLKSS